MLRRKTSERQTIDDPVLAGALFGAAWVRQQDPWAQRFSIWRSDSPPARAWFVPQREVDEAAIVEDWSGDPRDILRVLRGAAPLSTESRKPEEWTIWVDAIEPGWVIVTQIADPHWKARWIKQGVPRLLDPDIRPAFRRGNESVGWQCIEVPEAGSWGLRWNTTLLKRRSEWSSHSWRGPAGCWLCCGRASGAAGTGSPAPGATEES